MIVYKREPTVENVMEFVARFATSFQSAPKTEEEEQNENEDEEEEEEAEDDHPFLSFIFNFLLEVWTLLFCIYGYNVYYNVMYLKVWFSKGHGRVRYSGQKSNGFFLSNLSPLSLLFVIFWPDNQPIFPPALSASFSLFLYFAPFWHFFSPKI